MTTHELKTWPPYFQAIWERRKPFDVRPVKDRVFGEGDLLHLREFTPCETCTGRGFFVQKQSGFLPRYGKRHPCASCKGTKGDYTGRELTADVTYVLEGGRFGVEKGYVVMGISVKQRSSGRNPVVAE